MQQQLRFLSARSKREKKSNAMTTARYRAKNNNVYESHYTRHATADAFALICALYTTTYRGHSAKRIVRWCLVHELRHVCHDATLVRLIAVYIFRLQQSRNAQMCFSLRARFSFE